MIEQLGVYATPFEIEITSICAGTPVCQDVLFGAAAGVLIYKGVQTGIAIYKAQPKGSGKERATDAPSWAATYPRQPNEPCAAYAARILLQKYGPGDRAFERGPRSEYSKIKKACERGGL